MIETFLVDACALIAFYTGGGRSLSTAGKAAMQDNARVSPITVWELSQKIASGKLPPLFAFDRTGAQRRADDHHHRPSVRSYGVRTVW